MTDLGKKWGGAPSCPACNRTVYPAEAVFAADRKSFHKQCIRCAVRGCSNELTKRGMQTTESGERICQECWEQKYKPRQYGPPPGGETIAERRAREEQEAREREQKLREIEAMRGRKSSFGECPQVFCINIAQTCEIAPDKVYSL